MAGRKSVALEKIKMYHDSFERCAKDMIKVRDHNTASLMALEFRPGQQVMHDVAEKRKAERGYLRVLLLKNRRFGGSTYVAARGYHRAIFNFNQNIFIIGHETDSTNTLFKMVQLMQEKNPIPPATRTSNAQELIFDRQKKDGGVGLKSEYKLATAKNVEAGRSQGIHFLHGSEVAMWPGHAETLLASLYRTIPNPPADTEIWLESTGKGYGNYFQIEVYKTYANGQYPYYTAPLSKYAPHMVGSKAEFTFAYHDPERDWILIFIPWMIDPVCWLEFESKGRKKGFEHRLEMNNKKEGAVNYGALELQKKYGLRLEQLYWREQTIINTCMENVPLFNQENPTKISDAFISKGSNHYPSVFCDWVQSMCLEPVVTGRIMYRNGRPIVEPNPAGAFQVWENYDPSKEYFITVDAAGGKREIHEKEKRDPDKTVIDVWERRTGRQCAQWYGHIDYDLISEELVNIGNLYGQAVACVELNNHGYKVVGDLKTLKYPQYYWKPGEPGWSTNRKTKPIMADDLLMGCREGLIKIRCRETVEEMRAYVEISGRFGAEAGANDDRVTTAQMAVQMMQKLPRKIELQDDAYVDKYASQEPNAWMAV